MLWLTLSYAVIVVIPFIGIYVVTTIVVVYGFGVSGVGVCYVDFSVIIYNNNGYNIHDEYNNNNNDNDKTD